MAEQITIPIERDPDYLASDRVELEIDSVVQPDLIKLLDAVAEREIAAGDPPSVLMYRTLRRFVAGDYSVRLRGVDAAGNASAWSAAVTIEHRPEPEAAIGLAVSGGSLTGTWPGA